MVDSARSPPVRVPEQPPVRRRPELRQVVVQDASQRWRSRHVPDVAHRALLQLPTVPPLPRGRPRSTRDRSRLGQQQLAPAFLGQPEVVLGEHHGLLRKQRRVVHDRKERPQCRPGRPPRLPLHDLRGHGVEQPLPLPDVDHDRLSMARTVFGRGPLHGPEVVRTERLQLDRVVESVVEHRPLPRERLGSGLLTVELQRQGAKARRRWRRAAPVTVGTRLASIAARAATAPLTPPGLRGAAHGPRREPPPPAAGRLER